MTAEQMQAQRFPSHDSSSVAPARNLAPLPNPNSGARQPGAPYFPHATPDASTAELKGPLASRSAQPLVSGDVSQRFGSRLRDLRRSKNMTQLQMAVTFGIDRSYISDIECGKKGISLATLEVIAIGFEMPLSDLLSSL